MYIFLIISQMKHKDMNNKRNEKIMKAPQLYFFTIKDIA
ncbi:hypothetical protein SDC9_212813 [bioreactor metagenome]|uniref:Uncharacterized protein n=1 Tax=bioreactor metagenome TaxID=1076179 RepID=A0A645K0D6_9ZZZZ